MQTDVRLFCLFCVVCIICVAVRAKNNNSSP
jgi:hypothetical protein